MKKTQIGVGSKLIDRLGLVILITILIVVTASHFNERLLLLPFYLAFVLYAYRLKGKFYIYFEKGYFFIENAFSVVRIEASFYQEVTLSTLVNFSSYCEIVFSDGRYYKFLNDSRNVVELDRRIRNLIKLNK